MARNRHMETGEIPQLTNDLMVDDLYPMVRYGDSQPAARLMESLSAYHYAQVPLDRDVPAIPARRSTYFRLVVPSRVTGRTGVVEFAAGLPEEASALKAGMAEHIQRFAGRQVVRDLYGLVGGDVLDRVRRDPRNQVIAGISAGYVHDGQRGNIDEPTPHYSLLYARNLRLTDHFLQLKLDSMRAGGAVPEWFAGVESEDPILSTHEERTTRLAGMMAQSIMLHTFEQ